MKRYLNFIIPSLLGVFFFLVPLPFGRWMGLEGMAEVNIGVGALADIFKIILSEYLYLISVTVIVLSALATILAKIRRFSSDFLRGIFEVSWFWVICRLIGALFVIMVYMNFGPEFIIGENTGGSIISLIPSLLAIFFFTGYLLPLLTDFGFMDFVGSLISRFMIRLFHVPGRAAIDAISSWLGDGTLGVMITETQFKKGFYTAKQASIIAVCFSLVSLPFATTIATTLGIMHLFLPFYATVCLSSLACALILPRIYPLSRMGKDVDTREGVVTFGMALERARNRAESAPSVGSILKGGFKFSVDLYSSLLPVIMAWGTIALILCEYTPIFDYLGLPFEWIYSISGIPHSDKSGAAVMVGFADMFIPSLMVAGEDIELITKFVVGALSISQLVYLTETGAVIIKSSIPLGIKDLLVIFLLRTLISLPIIILVAKILFIVKC